MPILTGGKIIEGSPPEQLSYAGVPTAGTDEVQTITFGAATSGGTFRLAFMGWTTARITHVINDDAALIAAIDAALEALPNIGTGGVVAADGTLTNGVGTVTVTFSGTRLKKLAVPLITVAEMLLTDPGAVAVTDTTPGVDATFRDAAKGASLTDSLNGVAYVNTGVAGAPVWTAVGVASINQEFIDLAAALPVGAIADVAGLGIAIAAANPTAITGATPSAIAAADPAAIAGTTPAGGVGAAAGGYDTEVNRDAFIATVAEIKVTANAAVTLAKDLKARQAENLTLITDLKARQAENVTELTELKLDIATLSTTAVETKAQLNKLLVALRAAGVVTP